MPGGRVPSYASAVGVGRTADIWEEFWRYSCAFSCGDPRKSLFIMSNTWGDRSQDMAVCESFLMEELRCAKDLGMDILQIDDGWESGITANSLRKSGGVWQGYYANDPDFWKVNPDRFPNGLEPIVEKAREYGLEVGLWFGPDSSQEFANVEKGHRDHLGPVPALRRPVLQAGRRENPQQAQRGPVHPHAEGADPAQRRRHPL